MIQPPAGDVEPPTLAHPGRGVSSCTREQFREPAPVGHEVKYRPPVPVLDLSTWQLTTQMVSPQGSSQSILSPWQQFQHHSSCLQETPSDSGVSSCSDLSLVDDFPSPEFDIPNSPATPTSPVAPPPGHLQAPKFSTPPSVSRVRQPPSCELKSPCEDSRFTFPSPIQPHMGYLSPPTISTPSPGWSRVPTSVPSYMGGAPYTSSFQQHFGSTLPTVNQTGYSVSSMVHNNNSSSPGLRPVLDKLQTSHHGVFPQECSEVSVGGTFRRMPAFSPVTSMETPLSMQTGMLQMHFHAVQDRHNVKVRELQDMYKYHLAQIECQRFQSLSSVKDKPWMYSATNNHFDQLHLQLISIMERYLMDLTESVQCPPVASVTPVLKETIPCCVDKEEMGNSKENPSKPKSVPLNKVAVRIMGNWYERNQEHPYPSYDTAEVMAQAGGITVEQVKKWFANRRLRSRNTKPLKEIARRRKRSKDDQDAVVTEAKKLCDSLGQFDYYADYAV